LAWAGLAFAAFLFSPITALVRRLRRGRGTTVAELKSTPTPQPVTEPPGEGTDD
jgi:hypothetical protein